MKSNFLLLSTQNLLLLTENSTEMTFVALGSFLVLCNFVCRYSHFQDFWKLVLVSKHFSATNYGQEYCAWSITKFIGEPVIAIAKNDRLWKFSQTACWYRDICYKTETFASNICAVRYRISCRFTQERPLFNGREKQGNM